MFQTLDSIYQIFLKSTGVVIDSRAVVKDSLFFALIGEKVDGNDYALQALENGAIGAVVDNPLYKDNPGCIYVEDSLKMLQELAKHHRNTFDFPVIGLTGSNGKTTTKELLYSVLKKKYHVKATKGNLNNHIGVPLTLLDVREKLDFLIVEMGANHQGEIDFLCRMCRPDYGLITNIGFAHLDGFGGFEGVKKGKSELYRYIARHDGTLFVNGEDEILINSLPEKFSKEKLLSYYPSAHVVEDSSGTCLSFVYNNKLCTSQLVGDYNISNIIAAIEIAKYFGVPEPDTIDAVTKYSPSNNRSQLKAWKGMSLILDAYNANPSSMRASIENFGKHPSKQKVLVLGDMFELGDWAHQEHVDLVRFTESFSWEKVILVGHEFKKCNSLKLNYEFYEKPEEARSSFLSYENSGAVVLLKGSRGIKLEKLLEE